MEKRFPRTSWLSVAATPTERATWTRAVWTERPSNNPLDSSRSLKEKQAIEVTRGVVNPSDLGFLEGTLSCQVPTKELNVFQGIISVHDSEKKDIVGECAVDAQNLLLRGSVLKNSNWMAGMIVYTGRLTKLSLNMNTQKFKFSGIETSLNEFVPKVLFLQLALTLVRVVFCCEVDLLFGSASV